MDVVVVDDDADYRELLQVALGDYCGAQVREYADGHEALDPICGHPPKLLLLDYHMPVMSGLALMRALHERGVRVPTVVISGDASVAESAACIEEGAMEIVVKPARLDALVQTLQRITGALAPCDRIASP